MPSSDVSASDVSEPPGDLAAALAGQGIELPAGQVAQLAEYCRLLWDWNEKLNLTRHTDYQKFVTRDLVDTLWLARNLDEGERVLDVGTGGGVPGVVLAIIRPDLRVAVSESVGKKARAVADIVTQLRVPVRVHPGRAEELLAGESFDALTVRAVAPLAKLLTWFAPHWARIGRMLVIKGPAWTQERLAAREMGLFRHIELRKRASWPIANSSAESVLLEMKRKPPGQDCE